MPEVYGPSPLAELGYPDGIAFDEAGNLWVTFPAWNAIGFIRPDGELVMVLEDSRGVILRRPTNICFGWKTWKPPLSAVWTGQAFPIFGPHIQG